MLEPRKNERGAVLGIAVICLLVLSIVGIAAVNMATSEVQMAGNSRRTHQLQTCASAGLQSVVVQLPNVTNTSYLTGETQSASPGHLGGGTFAPATQAMPPSALQNVFLAGENMANRLSSTPGRTMYRIVETCQDAGGTAKAELSGAVLYGAGR